MMSKNYIIERSVEGDDDDLYTKRYLIRGNSAEEVENKIIESWMNVGVEREQIMLLELSIDVEFDGGHYNYMIINP